MFFINCIWIFIFIFLVIYQKYYTQYIWLLLVIYLFFQCLKIFRFLYKNIHQLIFFQKNPIFLLLFPNLFFQLYLLVEKKKPKEILLFFKRVLFHSSFRIKVSSIQFVNINIIIFSLSILILSIVNLMEYGILFLHLF